MKPHAFVAMPFGTKPDTDGSPIYFNRVYTDLLEPALESAGFEVFRADEEQRAGDIRTDMFQELLMADLVVADLTLDNPNVWYELGVRHALRARGVVLVQGPRTTQPFDIYTDRKLRYALKDGVPDPTTLAAEIDRLATMAKETLEAPSNRKVSPVYALLGHLREPQWSDLLLEGQNEFSQVYGHWARQMEVARRKNAPGDLLVLAEETPTLALRLQAKGTAGDCLMKLQQFAFALEQFDAALTIAPDDQISREKKGVCLGRLGRSEEAREWLRSLTDANLQDAEAWALTGRVLKEDWIARWRRIDAPPTQMREAAKAEDASLEQAISPYVHAFSNDARHYYSGINALTLSVLRRHLGSPVPAEAIESIAGGVWWAIQSALVRDPTDYWARASRAELSLLLRDAQAVVTDYRSVVATLNHDWFALDSSRQTLLLLRDLEFRPDETRAALSIVDSEIARFAPPFVPRKVFLFSGHMVDAPGRKEPRFPSTMVDAAVTRITAALDALRAGSGDLALTQGAAGGDVIFAEACAARGVHVQLMLPLAEPAFIDESLLPSAGGEDWRNRYFAIKAQQSTKIRVMPNELGALPKGGNAFERCNLWLLNTALACGIDKVHFICLWNGGDADGLGGTAHMYREVKRRTGQVTWIDTRQL